MVTIHFIREIKGKIHYLKRMISKAVPRVGEIVCFHTDANEYVVHQVSWSYEGDHDENTIVDVSLKRKP